MPLFTGSGVALVTPFNSDLSINYDKLAELLEFQISEGTDALFPVGTTGESSTLSDAEKTAVYKFCVERVKGRVPVALGTGSNDTAHAVHLTEAAAQAGADGILAVTPYYNKGNDSGLIHYYQSIAAAAKGRPVIVYNVPSRTGVHLSIRVLQEIAKTPNINMLKEASGNISYVAECAKEVPSLALYSGNDDMVVPLMSLGGYGTISVTANIMPKSVHQMAKAYLEGNVKEACRIQLANHDINKALFLETNPVPVKEALNLMGKGVGPCRSPLGPIGEDAKIKLLAALRGQGLVK